MTVLLTVPGLWGTHSRIEAMYRGSLTPGGQLPARFSVGPVTSVQHVRTYLGLLGASRTAGTLDTALNSTQDECLVVGHSEGALAILRWLDLYGQVDPGRVTFVTSGSKWSMKTVWLKRPYRIVDVTVRWDKWADYPDTPDAKQYRNAVRNCDAGNVHVDGYKDISLNTPDRENTVDTCTYLFYATSKPAIPDATTSQIETAYRRPWLRQGDA